MTFQEFIEGAKLLSIGLEYPYLPSPRTPETKKYKLLEVSENSIRVEREGEATSISISHIKTLLENMKINQPLDVEKTLGSGGNTRSIEESILCLMPSIFYTRINNRKHIVESSNLTHEIGILKEWSKPEDISIIQFSTDIASRRYITSLLTKPFVILAGNSGTGKTRIACKFSKQYSVSIPDYSKSLKDLCKYILEHDYDMNGVRLRSVSDTAVEVYNTKNKYICISFGIIQEYIDWYAQNGIASNPARSDMQEQGLYDGQSYSWDTTHIEKIAKFVLDYIKQERRGVYVSNHLLIPVGADWTDNTKILGYFNPLANGGKGEYVKTEILEFIETASENPEIPFFLILDEMNLSHVERYFSDFLSKMELLDYKENSEPVFFDIPGYGKLELPKNLFITGTVNIDETTYMFSPKVLDRANVIEFKPEMEDVLDNLLETSNGDDDKTAEPGVAEGFMKLANEVRSGTIPEEVQPLLKEIKPILESFYKELEKCGFEFAYRTVKEIRLYAIAAFKTAENENPTATDIADIQILQKILPKIHGNKKQIGSLLDELEKLCIKKDSIDSSVTPSITGTGYTLPASLAKIRQMKDRLNRFQYASFI